MTFDRLGRFAVRRRWWIVAAWAVLIASVAITEASLDEAALACPECSLVVISVPGAYAAREARKALEQGKHVFLFSDNVPLEQEVELKRLGRERGRLVMGPDCGTSLIGGVGIAFANRARRGPVGAEGGSGTGLQEFTSLVHQAGSGISHALGTGSHDLSDAVGGITTLMGLDALEADPATQVIAILSKPAEPETLQRLAQRVRACAKPVVGCFLGLGRRLEGWGEHFHQAATIDEAVGLALRLVQAREPESLMTQPVFLEKELRQEISAWRTGQRYLRGLFAGLAGRFVNRGGRMEFPARKPFGPLGLVVYAMLYLDMRMRREGLDLERRLEARA